MTFERGTTFIEILFVTALIAVLAGMAVPQALTAIDRSRGWAAARYLAGKMAVARSQAVMRSANVALRFDVNGSDYAFRMYVDGNRNGVRSADIASGLDRPIDTKVRLSDLFPGVAVAATPDIASSPVKLGSTNLLSFTPLGTSTSGSIYVRSRDGLQLAIRVLGATGRTRVLRYVPLTGQWVDSF